jgi:DUF438 domain-containing protein
MAKTKRNRKLRALTGLLKRMKEEDDLRVLCHEVGQLAEEVDQRDIATAEQALVKNGYSLQMTRQLLTQFVFMGMYERNTPRRQDSMDEAHILRRIRVEHDLFRCNVAELSSLAKTIMHLDEMSDVSAEFRSLVRVARYLSMLHEHMAREEDIIFPYLRKRGFSTLCLTAEKEHIRLRESVDNLLGLVLAMPGTALAEFKTRLLAIVHLLYPLLLDHLAFEDEVIHPIALVAIDNPDTWEAIKALCDQIGYCELPS